jgi:hypothetical protein
VADRLHQYVRFDLDVGRPTVQDKLEKGNYHQEKERIERREFKLLLALIHKLKTAAAVLERI